ncbi:MAG: NUDIX domain-containing protein, partial [Roseburia sp.]|nr:NUDIX domain-containing protein [Roseburia sp.]
MLFLENLKPLKIYKRPMYLPTIEGDKKKKSAIFLLTPNYLSSKALMTSQLLINKLRFASYYIEKDTTFFIGKKAMQEVEDVTETYVHNMTQYDLYQSLYEMSTTERNSLDNSVFGLPEKRKYPLDSIAHVKSAIKFFNYVDKEDEKELAKNINKAINKYHMTVNVGSKNRFSEYINESVVLTKVPKSVKLYHGSPTQGLKYLEPRAESVNDKLGRNEYVFASDNIRFAACYGSFWHDDIARQGSWDNWKSVTMGLSDKVEMDKPCSIYELENDGSFLRLNTNEVISTNKIKIKKEIKYKTYRDMLKDNNVEIMTYNDYVLRVKKSHELNESTLLESNINNPYNSPILEKEWGFTHVDGLYHALVKVEGIDKNLRGRAEMLVLDSTMTKVYLVFDKDEKDYKVPGGGFDYNETHLQSAIRETREEARIDAVGVYDTGVRYIKMYNDDPAVRQKEFDEENRFYGAYSEIFIGIYAGDTFDEELNTLDVDNKMTKGQFYPIEEVYDKLKPYHKKALNSTIKESSSVVIESQANLSNLGCYHLDIGRKGKNPKDIGAPWDEELYSKSLDSAIINDICGCPKDVVKNAIKKRDKLEVNVYTHGEGLDAIYLGKLTIRFFDITSNSNPDRVYKYGNCSFDWEWAEQEEISQELMNYYKEEVWKESVTDGFTPEYSVSANIQINGKELILYHNNLKCFTLPGGKQEPGEQPIETLKRELEEELGIIPTELSLYTVFEFSMNDHKNPGNIITTKHYNFDIHEYSGEILNKEPESHQYYTTKSFEEMKDLPLFESLRKVRDHYMNEKSVVCQYNEEIEADINLQNNITCSGYSKDLIWLKEIATSEMYREMLDALDLSIDDYEIVPKINYIAGDSENLDIDTNNNVIDVYCYSPLCASNVTRSGYIDYAIKASIVGLIVTKYPNLAGTVIPMCIAEAILGATEGFAKFALRMIAKYTMRGFFEKLTGMTTTEFFNMNQCKSDDLDRIEDLEQFVSESSDHVVT